LSFAAPPAGARREARAYVLGVPLVLAMSVGVLLAALAAPYVADGFRGPFLAGGRGVPV
jgi:hypothetical protein